MSEVGVGMVPQAFLLPPALVGGGVFVSGPPENKGFTH